MAGHLWTAGWVRDAVLLWHVPLFFMLTGYLWRPRSWRRELAARTSGLVRPDLGWLVVVALVVGGVSQFAPDLVTTAPDNPLALLWGGAALGGPFTAFWFVSCLFVVCLLYAAVDRNPWWRVGAAAVAAVTAGVGAEWLATLPLSIGVALPALLFIEAGRQLRRCTAILDHPLASVMAVLALAAAAAVISTGALPTSDLKVGDLGEPVIGLLIAVPIVAALLVLARRAARHLGARGARLLGALAGSLVPMVLLHPLVLALPGPDAVRFLLALTLPLGFASAVRNTAVRRMDRAVPPGHEVAHLSHLEIYTPVPEQS